jgi:hypothetical protein
VAVSAVVVEGLSVRGEIGRGETGQRVYVVLVGDFVKWRFDGYHCATD